MRVSLVYRGYTHDVVSRPGYNGSVSATSRSETTPAIRPDQHQPLGKDITAQTTQQQKSVQDWSREVSLKGWQYSDPLVTNFAQAVMAVTKMKEGRKGLEFDDRPSAYRPVDSVAGEGYPDREIRHDDTAVYTHVGEFRNTERLFLDETVTYDDHIRTVSETYKVEQDGRNTNTYGFYQLPFHVPNLEPEKQVKFAQDPINGVAAPSQWDQRNYPDPFLDIDESRPPSGNLQISLDSDSQQALQRLRLEGMGQALMTAAKIREGAALIEAPEPGSLRPESMIAADPEALNQAVNGPRETSARMMDQAAGEEADVMAALKALESGQMPDQARGDAEASLLRGPIDIQVGPGDTPAYDTYGAGGVDLQTDSADRALEMKAQLAQLNLALYTHHFGHDQIIPEDRTNRFQYDLIVGRRDLVVVEKPQRHYQVRGPRLESLPMALELAETKVWDQETAPVAFYPSTKYEFSLAYNPQFEGISSEGMYKIFLTPGLDRVDYGYKAYPRTERDDWITNSVHEERRDLLYTKRLPFSDELDLDKEYGRPEFPPETIVVIRRSDLPFEHRNNLRTERERDLVPDIPMSTQTSEHKRIEVENVHKDVENMRAEFVRENQLYGRDHSLLTEVINLETIAELDKFERRIDYLEGHHKVPIEMDPQDMVPPNVRALSLEDVVWGWNHKDQE